MKSIILNFAWKNLVWGPCWIISERIAQIEK